jgi:S-DNA-T family DNA segregation ATPase FtsK/SpoIIIE
VLLLREARWIGLIAFGVFLALILVTYDKADPGWSHAVTVRSIHNAGGRVIGRKDNA